MSWSFASRFIAVKSLILLIGVCLTLGGCSSRQLYYGGQAWRQSLCRESMGDDRTRCQSENRKSYDEHQREKAATND